MGTRDDEYDYLFKGNFVFKGGWLTACSFCRQKSGDSSNWGSQVQPVLMLKLALLSSTEVNDNMIAVDFRYKYNNYWIL